MCFWYARNDHIKLWVFYCERSNEIQFFPTDYQNFGAAKALSLENVEHFSSQVVTKNILFLLPVTTRQYITTLAQSGNQEIDNGESRVL